MLKSTSLQTKIFMYENDRVKEYIAFNINQITKYLHAARIDQYNRFSHCDQEVTRVFQSILKDFNEELTDFAHNMVGIRCFEYEISQLPESAGDRKTDLQFKIAYVRIHITSSLAKIVNRCNDIRRENELKNISIPIVMEQIIILLEALPHQNFYATFLGIKKPA